MFSLFFFPAAFIPSYPHLQFPLIVESLCLPCTHALSGNDVNRVKRFQGPRGRKTLRDFGVWLAEKRNEENALMRLDFLCRLLPHVSPTIQRRHYKLADALAYSLGATPFSLGVRHSWGSRRRLFSLLALSPFFLLARCDPLLFGTSKCGSSQGFRYSQSSRKPPSGRLDTEQAHFMSCMFIIN